MLKKKMAAGVVALAMFSTLGLAACNPGGSSSDSSSGGSSAAGSIPQPDVACDIPAGNLDDSKIDTSKVEGEITFQTQGLQNDFGDFFKAKIKEFEDANPGVKINWTDQGGGADLEAGVGGVGVSHGLDGEVVQVLPVGTGEGAGGDRWGHGRVHWSALRGPAGLVTGRAPPRRRAHAPCPRILPLPGS